APGDSHHPDDAAAPGLRRQPSDHLHAIILLLLCVLVGQQATRLAATAKIDANAGVAVAGQIGMRERVPLVSPVALAIGEIFQDRGNRVLLASSGSQMRAASVVPSFNGIHLCSITRTVRGNVVTITGTLQLEHADMSGFSACAQ